MRNNCLIDGRNGVFTFVSMILIVACAYGVPSITQQPTSQTVCVGEDVSFHVYASGTGLTYQWRKNGQDIDGAENHTLALTDVEAADEAVYDVVVDDGQGSVTSDPAMLTVDEGPEITVQPGDRDVCTGADVILSVTATSQVGELHYAWYKDSQLIIGAEAAALVLNDVTAATGGNYNVVVTNDCGWVTSATAVLGVHEGPTITEDLEDLSTCAGEEVTFSVTATTEMGDLSYEWYKDDEPIDGEEGASLTLASPVEEDSGEYYAFVYDDCGLTASASAVLLISAGPTIIEQPEGTSLCEGDEHTLSVEVESAGDEYQDVVGTTGFEFTAPRLRGNFYEATKTIALTRIEQYLTITTASELVFFVYEAEAYEGPYALVLEDHVANSGTGTRYFGSNPLNYQIQAGKYYILGAGWSASHKFYWSNTFEQNVSFGTKIIGFASWWQTPLPDPAPVSTSESSFMQRITTSDLGVTYQWMKDDEDIPGASAEEYTISGMTEDDAGEYTVRVMNDCGSSYSASVVMELHEAVTITQQPEAQYICTGGGAEFSVSITGGDGETTYQWRKDGVEIDGANAAAYVIAEVTEEDVGYYDVIIDNGCPVTSNAASLEVIEDTPEITQQPAGADACEGQGATLSVTTNCATGECEYQWYKDDGEVEGATAASYQIVELELDDAGEYYVAVTNLCGTVYSESATLNVDEALSITVHPQAPDPNELCIGESWMFGVDAEGSSLSYQWRKDGEILEGAVEDTYTIYLADPNDAGVYDVVVTNNCGEAISDGAGVRIVSQAEFLTHPEDQKLKPGERLELSVELDLTTLAPDIDEIGGADIAPPPGGFKLRGNAYAVETPTYLTKIEQYLEVTTSGALVFFVYEYVDDPNTGGGAYELILQDDVAASGTGDKYYSSNEIEVRLEAGRNYIIGAGWERSCGYYRADATHPVDTDFGYSLAGYADPYSGELPYQPEADQNIVWHQRLSTVTVDGLCQWRHDGVEIPGANDQVYVVESATYDDAGLYDVAVSNVCGDAVSGTAEVTLSVAREQQWIEQGTYFGFTPIEP